MIKFVVDGSKQITTTRPRRETTVVPASTVAPQPNTPLQQTLDESTPEEDITCVVDDKVEEYKMGEADSVQLVDLSYDSDNDPTELDEYDQEDNDVVLLHSLQEKIMEEETGIINVDDRPLYNDRSAYVDMSGDEDEVEPMVSPVLPAANPSTPKRKARSKNDDSSMMSSESKRIKTPEIPHRSHPPRNAKNDAAKKANKARKKTQRKTQGKKGTRKIEDMSESSEEDEDSKEESEE